MNKRIKERNEKIGKILREIQETSELYGVMPLELVKIALNEGSITFEQAQEYVLWWYSGGRISYLPEFHNVSLDAIASIVSCL